MNNHKIGIGSILYHIALSLLLVFLVVAQTKVIPVQAGSGPTVTIPQSNIVPVMDGICDPSEYIDATQVIVTVGADHTFPVFMKHTANDAYFCFGDDLGLPFPDGGESSVAVYIDIEGDGSLNSDDYGIWMPFSSLDSPWAAYWGPGHGYSGGDPGGWEAVKYQTIYDFPLWQVEFRISSQTMGGWKHTVGIALFYHWWRKESDDYSWPKNGVWAAPGFWGNGTFATNTVNIETSTTVPTVDGQCSSEYSDASTLDFDTPNGIATAYLEHSQTDVYVCLKNLVIPAPAQLNTSTAALYIDRTGTGGGMPSANDLSLTITYSGTVQVGTGDGTGYSGPDPGGYEIALSRYDGGWDAEFRISSATIGNWWSRSIGLSVAEQSITSTGDDYGWPIGFSTTVPNSWGVANLTGLGDPPLDRPFLYLPLVIRNY